jgi:hypothetical protein
MADIVLSEAPPRSRLLPSLRGLALMEAVVMLLPRWRLVAGLGMLFGLFYSGVILLATRDVVQSPTRIGTTDRAICRWSGPLAIATIALMFGIGFAIDGGIFDRVGHWLPRMPAWLQKSLNAAVFLCLIDISAVMCMACVFSSRHLPHVWPRLFWRIVCAPLLAITAIAMALGKVALVLEAVGWP